MRNETLCVNGMPISEAGFDSLTVPIHRASTIRFQNADEFSKRLHRGADGYIYGLYGTPTHRHLEKKITELEGGCRTVLTPSGQAAITMVMLTTLGTSDRVLIPDSVYGPVRDFAKHELNTMGINVTFYDPCDMAALEKLIMSGVRLVWAESPGSLTMEMQDIPRIAAVAHAHGALLGCDNTWASPLNFKPLEHGADFVVEALSKHLAGHSDILMGSITVRDEELGLRLKAALGRIGIGTSPDDCALVMRGIETLSVRIRHSGEAGLVIARWLATHPAVKRILHPALPDAPGHALWKRDFTGSAGVFTVEFDQASSQHILPALDALELVSIGASWGGTKSLAAPVTPGSLRSASPWAGPEVLLRLNIGLEHVDDLKIDFSRFLDRLEILTAQSKVTQRPQPNQMTGEMK
tara:strand:- start:6884 stop:8110 length:1227 start_codon:yes stop_codon:yes gene_type:complete